MGRKNILNFLEDEKRSSEKEIQDQLEAVKVIVMGKDDSARLTLKFQEEFQIVADSLRKAEAILGADPHIATFRQEWTELYKVGSVSFRRYSHPQYLRILSVFCRYLEEWLRVHE